MTTADAGAAVAVPPPAYRTSERERQRIADLFALMPASADSALDVGTRDGYLSRLLAERCRHVVALDLTQPDIAHPRIECRQGDVAALPFADDTFDIVLCAEVLEHIAARDLPRACAELARVARGALVIGVPYRQDLRYGRTICASCGASNPPWGHVNAFDDPRLRTLFAPLAVTRTSYVGMTRAYTNALSASLMAFAGNPYGTYEQDEPCVSCGARLTGPAPRTFVQKAATRVAFAIDGLQRCVSPSRANWIHVRFDKNRSPAHAASP